MHLKYFPHNIIASFMWFSALDKRSGIKKLVKQTLEGNKSGGYKKVYQRSNDGCARLSQRKISKVIMEAYENLA